MSRHIVSHDKYEVVVGWDPPVQSYFYQIIDPTLDEDHELLHTRGSYPHQIPDVKDLVTHLQLHDIDISGEERLIAMLMEEKENSEPPTPLQQKIAETFGFEL